MKPCPTCGNQLVNSALVCNGCGWNQEPCLPPMGFDKLREVARGRPWDLERQREAAEERAAIQQENEPPEAAW